MGEPGLSTGIVGREAERDAIALWLDGPLPAGLTIDGEAGIGKTTLLGYARQQTVERGDLVLAWRASTAERDLAFSSLAALLDRAEVEAALPAIREPRREALLAALGRVRLLPDRDRHDPSLVGFAVLDLVRFLSVHRRLTITLDDAQWCDPASEGALAFALRRLRDEPVELLLARRLPDEATGGRQLAESLDRFSRIEVGPLSVGSIGRLIRERIGTVHPRPTLVRLHEACAGNPFLALEISRALAARRLALGPGEPIPVPTAVGPLVRDHLSTLSGGARRSLVVVAISRRTSIGLLERVLGPDAADFLDEAVAAGVLVADGPWLRAAHPLIAATAFADAHPGELRSLHRALAEAVDDPLERAIHRAAQIEGTDPRVARELEGAAAIALARGGPGVAADLLERAAGLVPVADRAALLLRASSAHLASGDVAAATARLDEVIASTRSGTMRARALLALAEIVYLEDPPASLALLFEALEHAAGDPVLAATIHVSIAIMGDADPGAGRRSAEEAVRILESTVVGAEPRLLAFARLERAYGWLLSGQRAATEDLDAAIAEFHDNDDSFLGRSARERVERFLYHLGRLEESLAVDVAEHQRLSEHGEIGLLPPVVQAMSVLEQLLGHWTEARAYARECVDLVEQGEEIWRDRAAMAWGRVLAWEGELDAARSIATEALEREEAAGDLWEGTIFHALLGFIELSVPDPPAALAHLRQAAEGSDALHVALPTVFRFLGDYVEAATLAGDLDLAEWILTERLDASAERVPLPWTRAMRCRARGLLATARGEHEAAVTAFDEAVAVFDSELAMPFERARTLLARGQAQRRRDSRRAARADIASALDLFRALPARAWAQRAEDELRRVSGRAPSRDTLSVAERLVAERAAAGRTNNEIAAELVVSVRTVESQLSAVYRKLGIQSRHQLASALAEHA
jgi:DNA-binding NarL/FixJ family response regulator